jgi:hypothetical protein
MSLAMLTNRPPWEPNNKIIHTDQNLFIVCIDFISIFFANFQLEIFVLYLCKGFFKFQNALISPKFEKNIQISIFIQIGSTQSI